MNDLPPITPFRHRRRLTSAQLAALIQLIIAGALIVALALCTWWFFKAADRLGGARTFVYLPLAMAAFMVFALYRFVQAWRVLRRRGDDRQQR